MRFLFVGGGTGGHLTPAIGLAEGLEARGHTTLFLLSGRAIEQSFVADGRACKSLGFEKMRGPRALAVLAGALRARKMAKEFRPDVVVALGGAASVAALGILGAPLVLLEGNRVVGRSVRWMAGFSTLTLTMFEETAHSLRRAVAIGPVRRRSLNRFEVEESRLFFGLQPGLATLLVMGGSQGAQDLNQLALELLPSLVDLKWQMLALCGVNKGQALQDAAERGLPVVVHEHCDCMGQAYSAADFALTRGGASTVGELWLHTLPAAVLPYPWHKDCQQEQNARSLEPGILCLEQEQSLQQHVVTLLACLREEAKRHSMCMFLQNCQLGDGQEAGVSKLEAIAAKNA